MANKTQTAMLGVTKRQSTRAKNASQRFIEHTPEKSTSGHQGRQVRETLSLQNASPILVSINILGSGLLRSVLPQICQSPSDEQHGNKCGSGKELAMGKAHQHYCSRNHSGYC
jgi:hypothetical protein